EIPHPTGLAGHSDADVLLHAIIDALLGAAGLGDIGRMFPSADSRWEGADSAKLLEHAVGRVADAGHKVRNLDCTIVAEEPRLEPHLEAMREAISRSLKVESSAVSVKATTTDHLGFTGRG